MQTTQLFIAHVTYHKQKAETMLFIKQTYSDIEFTFKFIQTVFIILQIFITVQVVWTTIQEMCITYTLLL